MRARAVLFVTLILIQAFSSRTCGATTPPPADAAPGGAATHWRAQTINKAREWLLDGGGMLHKVDIVVATAGNVTDVDQQPSAADDDGTAGTCSESSGSNVCKADGARKEWAESVAGEDLGGVFASDDIEDGEVLFRIPLSFVHACGSTRTRTSTSTRGGHCSHPPSRLPPHFFSGTDGPL